MLYELSQRKIDEENQQQIIYLLSVCMWTDGDHQQLLRKASAQYEQYRTVPERHLYGWLDDDMGAFVGVLGITIHNTNTDEKEATCHIISHLSVLPELQTRGIGRRMLDGYVQKHPGIDVYAETDHDAVEFYRRCGFEIVALGEYYPGVMRFGCTR
ncbi:GNAT family N-acetyltransferase [Paenibacillus kandeliae]|uniref:GNAT family N-acetyltransferase n=1 Tax=Paenibacillus kandeliae TaxID=3231269 RepID=UPI003458B81E